MENLIKIGISIALLAIVPMVSAEIVELNISEDVKLNITQSLFNESTDRNISYFVLVENEGATLLKQVNITDILPPGVVYLWPNELEKNDTPQLICIIHNIDKTTKELTWQIGRIQTGESKWLNFTVQRRYKNIDASKNMVSSGGMALGFLINGTQRKMAVSYSIPKPAERMSNTEPQPPAETEVQLVENATNDSIRNGMLNDTLASP